MATDYREEFAESVKKYLCYRQMYEGACRSHANLREGPGWFGIAGGGIAVSGPVAIILRISERGAVALEEWPTILLLTFSIGFLVYVVLKIRAVQWYRNAMDEWSIKLLISVMRMTSFRKDIVWNASNERSYTSGARIYAYRTTKPATPVEGEQKDNAVFKAELIEKMDGCCLPSNGRCLSMKWINLFGYDIRDAYYELDRLDDIQTAIFEVAEQGDRYAQYLRGTLEKDAAVKAQWMRRAADAGLAEARYELGNWAASGYGVPQNLVFAYVWLHRCSAKWDLDMVAEQMNPEQIAEAKKLLRGPLSFLEKHAWLVKDKIGETIAAVKPFLTPLVKKPAEWMMKWMESNYWPLIFIVPILLWIVLTR